MPQFKPSDSVKPSLDITGTDAEALDVTGGAEFGSGDVELIGVDGKIQGPISSTIIDDLSGPNLTTLNASNISSGTLAAARLPAKVAVTSSDADALDVTGGLTIGSGDVALVGVDGKLSGPLSTTIIDDLSGANLTTLNASALSSGTVATARLGSGTASSSTFLRGDGAWNAAGGSVNVYATTIANVSNTTTATAIVTGAEIAADVWTDGGLLEIFMTFISNNQSGGNKTMELSVGVDDGSYKSHESNHVWEAPAAARYQSYVITMLRAGTDIYIGNGTSNMGPYGGTLGNPGSGNTPRITGIDFTTGIDPIIKVAFPSALSTLYITMTSAMIRLTPAGAIS